MYGVFCRFSLDLVGNRFCAFLGCTCMLRFKFSIYLSMSTWVGCLCFAISTVRMFNCCYLSAAFRKNARNYALARSDNVRWSWTLSPAHIRSISGPAIYHSVTSNLFYVRHTGTMIFHSEDKNRKSETIVIIIYYCIRHNRTMNAFQFSTFR